MTELTQNHQSFIQLMKKSQDHERRGVRLLLKRENFDSFFDALRAEDFFAPTSNPSLVPVDAEGTVQVPYWPMLDYLTACAERASATNDNDLASKVIDVALALAILDTTVVYGAHGILQQFFQCRFTPGNARTVLAHFQT